MYIGIIVYSVSGHTRIVAEALRERLAAQGHAVDIKAVTIEEPQTLQNEAASLQDIPQVQGYHALVLASPVRGGVIPSPMLRYLQQLPELPGIPAACLVTGFFRMDWGQMQVLAHMQELLEAKGAVVKGSGGVQWSSFKRKRLKEQAVESLALLF